MATLTQMISAPRLGVVPYLTDLDVNPITRRRDLGGYLDLGLWLTQK